MMSTRDRLLAKAKQRFNEEGLARVGVRDLARDLGLSPGNVSYHFPKKEALVRALMAQLRELNQRTLEEASAQATLTAFLERYRQVFQNQLEFRFLARGISHIVEAYPQLGADYRRVDGERRRTLAAALMRLREAGELSASFDARAVARVVALCTLTARFWLSEYALSYAQAPEGAVVDHYLGLIAHALLPYVPPKRRRALSPWLNRVLVDETLMRGA